MSPQIRRIIGLVAIIIGAIMLGRYGNGFRPIALIAIGIIFLILPNRGR